MNYSTHEISDRLLRVCTERMLQTVGYKVHDLLMTYCNQRINVIRVQNLIYPEYDDPLPSDNPFLGDDDYEEFFNGNPECRMKAYDGKTLILIAARFIHLRNREAKYKANNESDKLAEVRGEIDFLNDYLRMKTLSNNLTDQISELERKAYEAINAAVTRFWKQVRKRDEELYWLLKAHLRIGIFCVWYDDNPATPLYLPNL